MFKTYETELAGRKLVIETGKMAGFANGSVLVRYGDTCVLVNVTASKEPKEGIDFFPLSVEFEEKLYSVGKIPGGFLKREGKPSDKAILTARAIDRPLRPLFPKDFRNDVVVDATVLCVEQDNSPEIAAMIGAATALAISDIPFNGPTAAVNVGLVDGKIIINPTEEEREKSDLTLTVAATEKKITMIEAGANEIPNDVMLDAIKTAIKNVQIFAQKQLDCIRNLDTECDGIKLGHRIIPIKKAGCYIPGGNYPLPSTAIMTIVPAKTAGVETVIACSPKIKDVTIVACDLAGADKIYRVGKNEKDIK